jgi:microcystin-dependent protein
MAKKLCNTCNTNTCPPGPKGPKGDKGDKGDTGAPGLAGVAGVAGSKGDKGDTGSNGTTGLSAYQVWIANGNVGTVQDFLDSLSGSTGTTATVTVLNTTTLPAGNLATVTLDGTSTPTNTVLNFGIPEGDIGLTGLQGGIGKTGNPGSNSLIYYTDTVNPNPADGNFKLNNTSFALATEIKINRTSKLGYSGADASSGNALNWLSVIALNSIIQIYSVSDNTQFGIYKVTGLAAGINCTIYTVTVVASNGSCNIVNENYTISYSAAGSTGATGSAGSTGAQGPIGPTGATGAIGPQGSMGLQGPVGPQGTQGPQGVTGPIGPQGPIGPSVDPGLVFPTGMVMPFAGGDMSCVPGGWLICDGTAVSRVTYSDLFACVGETYGPGDASTTFNLPDLQASIPVGVTPSLGVVGDIGGTNNQTLVAANLPQHTHGAGTLQPLANGSTDINAAWDAAYAGTDSSNGDNRSIGGQPDWSGQVTGGMQWPLTISGATDSGTGLTNPATAFNNMQKYVLMKYLIKS